MFWNIDKSDNISKLLSVTVELDDYQKIEKNAYEKACKVYQNYPLAKSFIERIKSVTIKSLNEQDGVLEVRPKQLDEKKSIKICVVTDRNEFIALQKKGDVVWVGSELSGFEGIYIIAIQREEFGEKRKYIHIVEGDVYSIIDCLNQITETIVFDKLKIITRIGHNSIKGVCEKKPVFVNIDVPIVSQIDRIKDFFGQGEYVYFDYDGHSVLVCKKKQVVLFADVLNEAKDRLDELFYRTINKNNDVDFINEDIKKIYHYCREFEISDLNQIENSKIKAFLRTKNSR